MSSQGQVGPSPAPPQLGPYLKAALFCDQVIEGKDGVLSLIRVVDRLTTVASGPGAPKDMTPVTHPLLAVIMLSSGSARGPEEVRLEMERPDGQRKDVWTGTVHMEGEDKGQNLVLNFPTTFELAGLYWFNLYMGDHLLTKMPFRLMYTRFSSGGH